jgi:hypothetical protein
MRGCVSNISAHQFNPSFQARKDSCLFDIQGNGFWRDPQYIFRANLSDLISSKAVSLATCAFQCTSTSGCIAFDYNEMSQKCTLKVGAILYVCDPGQNGCNSQQPGFYGASTGFYFADSDDLYCSSQSADCACTREYYYCMSASGCMSQADLGPYARACAEKGCTAPQCGLPAVVCNASSRCNEQYLGCTTTALASGSVGIGCICIQNMTKCLKDSGCLINGNDLSLQANPFAITANQIYDW